MVLSTTEELVKKLKKAEYVVHVQKVSSFFRMAFHSGSTRRIYLSEKDFKEYPLGQEFKVQKVSKKQDMADIVQYDERLESIELPILVCFPEKEGEAK